MQIKNKLSIYFTLVSALLSLIVSIAVNVLFSQHTEDEFFKALKERAIVTAQVYLETDEISESSLQHFKNEYLNSLPDEIIRMYDSSGNPAFIKDNRENWPKTIINKILKDRYQQYTNKKAGVVGIRYDDNQGTFVIIVSATDKAGEQSRKGLLQITIVLYFLQLIVLFFISRLFAARALLPIQKINRQVQMINATDLHLRVDEGNGKDEISELGINFNSLLKRLETSFEMQKTFVANASHELRTPLTSIIGEIEVTSAIQRDNEEYKQVLASVLNEAEKLNGVIEGLVTLASAENIIALHSVQSVRVDDLLLEIHEACKKSNPSNILYITLESLPEDENKLCVKANKHLLDIALTNVIRNAFKFSYNQQVDCNLNYTSAGINITIKDKGAGISKDAIDKIFDPFYRSPESSKFDGQGLGLFIAKKIISLYNGTISIVSSSSSGTTVNIAFS